MTDNNGDETPKSSHIIGKIIVGIIILSIIGTVVLVGYSLLNPQPAEEGIVGVWQTDFGIRQMYIFIYPDGSGLLTTHYIDRAEEADDPVELTWKKKSSSEYLITGKTTQKGIYVLSEDGLQLGFETYRVYTKFILTDSWLDLIHQYPNRELELASVCMEVGYENYISENPPGWYGMAEFVEQHTFDTKNTIPASIEDTIISIATSYEMADFLYLYDSGHTAEFRKITGIYDEKTGNLELVYEYTDYAKDGSWVVERKTVNGKYYSTTKTLSITTLRIDMDLTNKYDYGELAYEIDTYQPAYTIQYISDEKCEAKGNQYGFSYHQYRADGTQIR